MKNCTHFALTVFRKMQFTDLHMKKIVSLFAGVTALVALIGVASSVYGADQYPPERLTYQGYLVDGNGVALATNAPKNYDVIFTIYDAQTAGNKKWAEQQTVTVDKGYFSVLLGEGSQVGSDPHPNISTIFTTTDSSDRYVALTVKGIGPSNTDVDILPRLRMMTAPYAYLARNANNASSLVNATNNQIVTVSGLNVGINKTNLPSTALDVNGTVTATAFAGNGAAITAINAGNLTTGTLDVNRVPSLDSAKITTGTLDPLRIPNLDSAKITTGTLDPLRIPSLDASKITTGTLNNSRLSSTVGRTDVAQTYTARPIFNASLTLNQNSIFIRGDADPNHVLRYASTYNSMSMDGPLLSGWQGGMLGTAGSGYGELATVIWNSLGVTIQGQAASNPTASIAQQAAQHLTIQARDLLGSGVRLTLGMTHVNNIEYAGIIQAYGGNGASYTTLRLNPLGGSVYSNSDRNAKKDFTPIDSKKILDRLSAMPLTKWSYKGEDGIYHIGPMAQDFKAAFDLGADDRSIALPDGAGVAMAAIQGLNEVVKEKDDEIQDLKKEVGQLREMKKELENLRTLVDSLAKKQAADRQ